MPPHCDSLDGPVVMAAKKALENSDVNLILPYVPQEGEEEEIENRFHHMLHARRHAGESVERAREYVEAMLGLQVWSHKVYTSLKSQPHEGHHEHS